MHNGGSQEALEGVAIIGMAGRFPRARTVEEFWDNLRDGVETISFYTDEELEAAGVDSALLNDPNYVKAGTLLEDAEWFDAAFFGFNPREAELTDPQHRVFLECAWEALENAGYDAERFKGAIGVYAGISLNTYLLFNLYSNAEARRLASGFQIGVGNDKDFLATRVSYKLNLKGPSVVVQSACSTSLVAVHLACQSLLNYESDLTLAGGVSISFPQKRGYLYQEGGITSPDGHCRAFDAQAQGTVAGKGVGIVVLKRLADAVADGDSIQAVIKGSAINNDGSLKIGYTAPSLEGQAQVIAMAQALAGVEAETITYIEAHGTATPLGDPVEVAAQVRAFRATTRKKNFCAVGSVKTNIGHLDAAAGIAGLIKTVLALKHQLLPPSLHFEKPNPGIDFADTPFYVNDRLSAWKAGPTPRRAGVSSFGIGGTNAHVILEEAPPVESSSSWRPWQLLLLSAKTSTALDSATLNLARHLRQGPDLNLADVAYTSQVGRRAFNHRRMVVCGSLENAAVALESLDPKRVVTRSKAEGTPSVAFMFPGQGAQYVGMAQQLYETETIFRTQVDRCSELLQPRLGVDLRRVLYPDDENVQFATEQLTQTIITQPALFVIEYAMAALWSELGVRPAAMIGHSIGEYVAACLAGVFSLEEALRLVARRGQLMQQLPPGSMLAVPLPESEIRTYLSEQLSLAATNTAALCVVSGPSEEIDRLTVKLGEQGLSAQRLRTSHAFHSTMTEPILAEFTEAVGTVDLKPPTIPYLSNLTGTWITAEAATDPSYWAKHLRQTVRFCEGIEELLSEPNRIFLEVGPGETLSTLTRRHSSKATEQLVLSSSRRALNKETDGTALLHTLGQLWLAGVQVDWFKFHADERRRRLPLPSYPFERQRYWVEPQKESAEVAQSLERRADIADWFYAPLWKQSIPPKFVTSDNPVQPKSSWLVFVDDCGIGSAIVEQLEQQEHSVVTVAAGRQFKRIAETAYAIDPMKPRDYELLLGEFRALHEGPQRVVHLWNITAGDDPPSRIEAFEKFQGPSFFSLLFLAQALGDQAGHRSVHLDVVSNNMQAVTGEEKLCPEKAILLGPCRVIPQEYPGITCRSIDIDTSQFKPGPTERLLGQFLAGVPVEPSGAARAYRGNHEWVQIFEPVRLEAGRAAKLRAGGVYLITGGLGGLGLTFAEYLANAAQAKLVLIGRSPFPARDEWDGWLAAHQNGDEVSGKIKRLQAIEQLGAELMLARADVTDSSQVRGVVSRAQERFGAIHGVIHAAGTASPGLTQFKTAESVAAVLAPKVLGTLALDEAFIGAPLDFMVLCSSLSAILGVPGQIDYCAANAFLDAFAAYHASRRETLTVSIDWPSWQSVGMAAAVSSRKGEEESLSERLKIERITPAEGVDGLGRILRSGLSQVVVSPQSLKALAARQSDLSVNSILEAREAARSPGRGHPRPQLAIPYVAPGNEIERTLATIWQELLGIEQIGIHDNYFELGGDSVLSIQIVAKANESGLRLTARQCFEYPTIAELAQVVGAATSVEVEQGPLTGPLPLTPIQHAFFELDSPDPHHFNQAILFKVRQSLNSKLLESAIQELLVHHDSLRLRFWRGPSGWQQKNAEPNHVVPLSCIDLAGLTKTEQTSAIETTAGQLQPSLNLAEGPIVRVALFDLGAGRSMRLLFIAHHLAVDAVSWRILLEDLQTAYEQLSQNGAIRLPAKTTSYKHWAEQLGACAQSPEVEGQLDFWLAQQSKAFNGLPLDFEGINTAASFRRVSVSLSAKETQFLLREVPKVYQTQINDVLLTALAQSFSGWSRAKSLLIDLEGHGREEIMEDLDLSRTVGWFTTVFPVLLEGGGTANPGAELKKIKEQLRRIPQGGIGYGLLRYLNRTAGVAERLQGLPQAQVSFVYLGQFDQMISASSLFGPAPESSGPTSSAGGTRRYVLEVSSLVAEGCLQITWAYSENLHRSSTVERLANNFLEALRAIVAHCHSPAAGGYTPSDFPEADLSQKELDELLAELSPVE